MTPEEACSLKQDLTNHYGYIYCLTFPNGKKYVGQSKRPWKRRWNCHKSSKSLCAALKNALIKYSVETISWELLEYADTPQALTDRETYYIQTLSTLSPDGYNISLPCNTCPYPEERKDRLRLGLALHHLHKTNPDATVEDAKQYIADQDYKKAHKVKKGTPEWIEQCKRVAKKREEELRAKWKSRKEMVHKAACKHKESIICSHINSPRDRQYVGTAITKEIVVLETGEHFFSVMDFCEKYNVPNSSATLCLQKKNKHVHNFHIYPAGISEKELASYKKFWNETRQQQTGVLTCLETKKTYNNAQEVADEFGVLKSRVYLAARFPNRNIKGFHFSYL